MFSDMQQRLSETASSLISQTSEQLVEVVPQIILAVVVLTVSVVVAHVVCKVVKHIFDVLGLDKIANKVNFDRMLAKIGVKRSVSSIFCFLIYWLIILVALLMISDVLNLGAVSDAIGSIVSYIPRIIAGLLILVIGMILGRFFRDVVSTFLARGGIASSELLGAVSQAVIVIFVCLLSLQQVGFDVSVITMNVARILGVALVAGGLAVALAIRPVLENMFACRQIKVHLKLGDVVECDCTKGEVVRFSLTSVVIRDGDDEVVMPAKHLFEKRFSKRTKTSN